MNIGLGKFIRDYVISSKNDHLNGWKDDKEKFRINLINDIKNFLFTKWEKPWTPGLIFDSNGEIISGFRSTNNRVYKNTGNLLVLASKKGKSPYFITLNNIKKQGGKILDKSKVCAVISYVPIDTDDDGKVDYFAPKFYEVINVDFVSGIKKPEFKKINFEKTELNEYVENFLKQLIRKKRVPGIKYDQSDQCFYRSNPPFYSIDEIHMVEIKQFKKINSYYSTLFHEIVHSTMNPKRLGRKNKKDKKTVKLAYPNEELVAEMGAMMISTELSLEYSRQNSITYLKGWLTKARDNHASIDDALLEAYSYACDAVEYLIEGVDLKKLVPKAMTSKLEPSLAKPATGNIRINRVQNASEELRLIKSFIKLHNQVRTKKQVYALLQTIQTAIQSKRITKKSKYCQIIERIQDQLIDVYNKMGDSIQLTINPKTLAEYKKLTGHIGVFEALTIFKKYVSLSNSPNLIRAQSLLREINEQIDSNLIAKGDLYHDDIVYIKNSLNDYITGKSKCLKTGSETLGYIRSIKFELLTGEEARKFAREALRKRFPYGTAKDRKLGYWRVEGLKNTKYIAFDNLTNHMFMEDFKFKKDAIAWLKGELSDQVFKPQKEKAALSGIDINATEVISSVQLVNHRFNNILKLNGEWGKVIGNPALPFRMMIYGMPGSGKSTGSISFASYLAKQHNLRILYVAAEENKGYTLAEKLIRLQAAHPNLLVANKFPTDLSPYDFIFIDSVNQMKLTPEMLDKMFRLSGKSFVYVFQVTKDGKFKGDQDFEHDVDVVLTTCLNDGHSTINTKKSRFGGSGAMRIF